MKFDNLKIRDKILSGFAMVILLIFLFGFFYLLPRIKETNHDLIESRTNQVVDVGYAIVDHFYKEFKSGKFSEEEAKALAISTLKTIRYSGSEYFWINDYNPTMVVHPNADLIGKDLSNFADPDGVKLFVEMVSVVKQKGEGFVYYKWEKQGSSTPEPKVSFVKGFKEWGWIVGSGVYIDDIEKVQSQITYALMFFMVISMVIIALIAIFIASKVTKGIQKSVDISKQIAEGDLTVSVDIEQKDEVGKLGEALKNMIDKLKEIVENVQAGASGIAGASLEVSSAAQQMSQGASEQASAAEQVSSSMEEMASNIQQNTDNAQQADKISINTSKVVQNVGAASQESLDSIRNIASKITIISDIAFQTNILALNAAIEAARAGEHGKGFAVVASEVRKLAERSKIAADEIVALADKSVKVTESAGQLMMELIPEIEKTARLVQEIAAASNEQNSGSNQINNAIQQLNLVTQQNAAASEELATSSEEMNGQAEQLKEMISFFKIETTKKKFSATQTIIHNQPKASPKTTGGNGVKIAAKPAKGKGIDLKGFDKDRTDNDFEKF
jgi:methyl-accepting chemotaxis protein